ncbi:hypothetical protein Tcan_00744, partial [Toxocara canis]
MNASHWAVGSPGYSLIGYLKEASVPTGISLRSNVIREFDSPMWRCAITKKRILIPGLGLLFELLCVFLASLVRSIGGCNPVQPSSSLHFPCQPHKTKASTATVL